MNNLTFLLWWAYAIYTFKYLKVGIDSPETRRTAAAKRFFFVRIIWQPNLFMGVSCGRAYALPVPCSGLSTCMTRPPCLTVGRRESLTAKQGVCHGCT